MSRFSIISFLLIILLLASCDRSYRTLTYLQEKKGINPDTIYKNQSPIYKINISDQLYITIKSLNPQIDQLFNGLNGNSSSASYSSGTGGGMYLMSYSVDSFGYIKLPIIGDVRVLDLKLDDARDTLQAKVDIYIKGAFVTLKLVSFRVFILGETNGRGIQTVMYDKANILEVIAQAGDITYNGNKRKVWIYRPVINGYQAFKVDLTSRDIFTSDKFYLKPNDIVYVEPIRSAAFRLNVTDYITVLSVLTSTITLIVLLTAFRL